MAKIKTKDFVKLDYTGMLAESNEAFDTTVEQAAKDNDIYSENMTYEPITVCVGEEQVPKGLDEALVGKEVGTFEIILEPEQAFGRKSAKLLKMVPASVFKKQQINPTVGLQVDIDGHMGIIKTSSGGRTVVDFNHPLSSRQVKYKVDIKRIITDDSEKIRGYLSLQFNLKPETFKIEVNEGKVTIGIEKGEFPKELQEPVKEKLINLIDSVKDVSFTSPEVAQKSKISGTTSGTQKKEV